MPQPTRQEEGSSSGDGVSFRSPRSASTESSDSNKMLHLPSFSTPLSQFSLSQEPLSQAHHRYQDGFGTQSEPIDLSQSMDIEEKNDNDDDERLVLKPADVCNVVKSDGENYGVENQGQDNAADSRHAASDLARGKPVRQLDNEDDLNDQSQSASNENQSEGEESGPFLSQRLVENFEKQNVCDLVEVRDPEARDDNSDTSGDTTINEESFLERIEAKKSAHAADSGELSNEAANTTENNESPVVNEQEAISNSKDGSSCNDDDISSQERPQHTPMELVLETQAPKITLAHLQELPNQDLGLEPALETISESFRMPSNIENYNDSHSVKSENSKDSADPHILQLAHEKKKTNLIIDTSTPSSISKIGLPPSLSPSPQSESNTATKINENIARLTSILNSSLSTPPPLQGTGDDLGSTDLASVSKHSIPVESGASGKRGAVNGPKAPNSHTDKSTDSHTAQGDERGDEGAGDEQNGGNGVNDRERQEKCIQTNDTPVNTAIDHTNIYQMKHVEPAPVPGQNTLAPPIQAASAPMEDSESTILPLQMAKDFQPPSDNPPERMAPSAPAADPPVERRFDDETQPVTEMPVSIASPAAQAATAQANSPREIHVASRAPVSATTTADAPPKANSVNSLLLHACDSQMVIDCIEWWCYVILHENNFMPYNGALSSFEALQRQMQIMKDPPPKVGRLYTRVYIVSVWQMALQLEDDSNLFYRTGSERGSAIDTSGESLGNLLEEIISLHDACNRDDADSDPRLSECDTVNSTRPSLQKPLLEKQAMRQFREVQSLISFHRLTAMFNNELYQRNFRTCDDMWSLVDSYKKSLEEIVQGARSHGDDSDSSECSSVCIALFKRLAISTEYRNRNNSVAAEVKLIRQRIAEATAEVSSEDDRRILSRRKNDMGCFSFSLTDLQRRCLELLRQWHISVLTCPALVRLGYQGVNAATSSDSPASSQDETILAGVGRAPLREKQRTMEQKLGAMLQQKNHRSPKKKRRRRERDRVHERDESDGDLTSQVVTDEGSKDNTILHGRKHKNIESIIESRKESGNIIGTEIEAPNIRQQRKTPDDSDSDIDSRRTTRTKQNNEKPQSHSIVQTNLKVAIPQGIITWPGSSDDNSTDSTIESSMSQPLLSDPKKRPGNRSTLIQGYWIGQTLLSTRSNPRNSRASDASNPQTRPISGTHQSRPAKRSRTVEDDLFDDQPEDRNSRVQRRRFFSYEEEQAVIKGFRQFGRKWERIANTFPCLSNRSGQQVMDKAKHLGLI